VFGCDGQVVPFTGLKDFAAILSQAWISLGYSSKRANLFGGRGDRKSTISGNRPVLPRAYPSDRT
jgi:hypothetical protein